MSPPKAISALATQGLKGSVPCVEEDKDLKAKERLLAELSLAAPSRNPCEATDVTQATREDLRKVARPE